MKKIKVIKKNISKLITRFKQVFEITFMYFIQIFILVKPKRVLFLSETRSELDGNLKYMYDRISDKEYEKILILKEDRRTKISLKNKLYLYKMLSSSKYIFLEDMVTTTAYFHFKKKQEIIQLWHAAGAYKKFGFSRHKRNGGDAIRVHNGYKKYTKAIVSGEGIRENYAEAFNIDISKVYATGLLRTDAFFDKKYKKEKMKELYKKYPFLKEKKVILFAPTYRGTPYRNTNLGGANYNFNKLDFEDIYKKLHNEYVFIFKWHPALYNNIINGQIKLPNLDKYKDFYYDFSSYREINELLLITDILITDYSSVIFDYALLQKPIVYFTYDLEEYENGRGMYYSFDEYVYGQVAKTSSELVKYIKAGDMKENKRKKFLAKFMSACDGNATNKTYDLIFKKEK